MSTHRTLRRPHHLTLLPFGLLACYGLFWAYLALHLPVEWVVVPVALALVICAVVIRRDLRAEAAARQVPSYQAYRRDQDRMRQHIQDYSRSLENPGLPTAELHRIAAQAQSEANEASQPPVTFTRTPETWLGLTTTMTVQLRIVSRSRVEALNHRAEHEAITAGRIPEDAARAEQARDALARRLGAIATTAQQLLDQRLLAEIPGPDKPGSPHHV